MAKDSLYMIGPVNLMEGLLHVPDFKNRGAVRYSLDGKKLLLEEAPEKFSNALKNNPLIETFNEEECRQYLVDNKVDWEEEDPELI